MSNLGELALKARELAYAPYSGYKVGAAVEDAEGRVFTGCNVENISYGLTLCAERVAVVKMVSEGSLRIRRIAVATQDGGTPCGACLQVLAEFADPSEPFEVQLISEKGEVKNYQFIELLPHGFSSASVKRL